MNLENWDMQIKKLTILGFSEATLTMIFDTLESNSYFPEIVVVNNLGLTPQKKYENKNFNIKIQSDLENTENYLIGSARKDIRLKIREVFSHLDTNQFISIISKNTDISSTTEIGYGVIINGMVCIAGQSKINDFVYLNRGCSIGHHTEIGEFTSVNPGVNIAGNISIGKNCQIGIGANIIDGITIGDNTIIGAGSVVTKNIPSNVVAYGNPCKVIRENI